MNLRFDETQELDDVSSHIRAFSVRGALSPLLLVPLFVPIVVALFAPDNVLDFWPWAQDFTRLVQRALPFMNMSAHANSTWFPQIALLAHSSTVTVIPLMALVWLWQSIVNYPRLLALRKARGRLTIKQHIYMTVLAPPLFLGSVYVFIALPGDPKWGSHLTTHSRAGFSFITLLAVYLTSAALGLQVLAIRLFVDLYIRKGA